MIRQSKVHGSHELKEFGAQVRGAHLGRSEDRDRKVPVQ